MSDAHHPGEATGAPVVTRLTTLGPEAAGRPDRPVAVARFDDTDPDDGAPDDGAPNGPVLDDGGADRSGVAGGPEARGEPASSRVRQVDLFGEPPAPDPDPAPEVARLGELRPAGRGRAGRPRREGSDPATRVSDRDRSAAGAPVQEGATGADPTRRGRRRRAAGGGRSDGRAVRPAEPPADPVAEAKAICLRLLEARPRTRLELAQALRRKGIPDDAAEAALERFGEVGLVDDAAFAGQWVRSRHAHGGLGRRAIAVELRRKGVDSETAGEALAEVDAASEEARARALVARKIGRRAPDEATARRLVGMLARKGYPAGIAYRVVREALAEHAAELAEQVPVDED